MKWLQPIFKQSNTHFPYTTLFRSTKMVFTGDIQQIDQPYLDSQSNGLVYMIDRMRDQNLFAHVNLVKGERSQLSELASNLM